MGEFNNIKKVCSFYISRTHFITMILPYVNQEIEKENAINTFLEYNFEQTTEEVLKKIILKDEKRKMIEEINWNSTKVLKASDVERIIKKSIKKENNNMKIIISGGNEYINKVNNIIDKYFEKNNLFQKNITIVNSYEVDFFNNNIREILNKHEFILNTSGLNKIEDVFEGYEKKKVN